MKPILVILTSIILSVFTMDIHAQEIKKENLYGTWYHSFEEDNDDYIVYRPKEFKFPPARVREKIEITENGEFFEHRVTPSDGYAKFKGNYNVCELHKDLTIVFSENGKERKRKYHILESTKKVLKLKPE